MGGLASEVVGDPVVVERVGTRDRVRVAAHPLDALAGHRALPQADQPEPGDAAPGERVELLVRDGVQRVDLPAVPARQLVQPDVRALGDEHEARHPRGIHAERLGFVEGAPKGRRMDRTLAVSTTAAAAEPAMQTQLLLVEHPDGDVELVDQGRERVAQDVAPGRADVAQLSEQRGRGMAGRRAHELDQREPGPTDLRSVGEDPLQAGDGLLVARALDEDPVVDELAERAERRVLVGHPGEQELHQPDVRRFRVRGRAGELAGEAVQEPVGVAVAHPVPHRGQRDRHRRPAAATVVAVDEQVADLVDQAEGHDLRGQDRWRPTRSVGVHPDGQATDRGRLGDDEVAADPHQRTGDVVPVAGGTPDVERVSGRGAGPHRPRMAPPADRRQALAASTGRPATTCSTARRSSSSPDGSNS